MSPWCGWGLRSSSCGDATRCPLRCTNRPAWRGAIHALAQQGRRYKVVYHSSSLAGQIAAVESGLAVAALTHCSVPPQLQVLGTEHGLGPLAPMEVAVYRSRASRGSKAVDSLQNLLVQTLRQSGGARVTG